MTFQQGKEYSAVLWLHGAGWISEVFISGIVFALTVAALTLTWGKKTPIVPSEILMTMLALVVLLMTLCQPVSLLDHLFTCKTCLTNPVLRCYEKVLWEVPTGLFIQGVGIALFCLAPWNAEWDHRKRRTAIGICVGSLVIWIMFSVLGNCGNSEESQIPAYIYWVVTLTVLHLGPIVAGCLKFWCHPSEVQEPGSITVGKIAEKHMVRCVGAVTCLRLVHLVLLSFVLEKAQIGLGSFVIDLLLHVTFMVGTPATLLFMNWNSRLTVGKDQSKQLSGGDDTTLVAAQNGHFAPPDVVLCTPLLVTGTSVKAVTIRISNLGT